MADAPARRVLIVYGTRPEVIKLAPVIAAARADAALDPIVCTTAQHREILDQTQATFGLTPDIDLDLMEPAQSLDELAARILTSMHGVIAKTRPDVVVTQGDTTTAMAAALAGFHARVAVAHVEAGLRSGDLALPFPEEANRRIIDSFAHYLFAPTASATAALIAEGHSSERIFCTGNTVVDALRIVAGSSVSPTRYDDVLVTVHRRESHGPIMRGILGAIKQLAAEYPQPTFTLPMHPNPAVRADVVEILGDIPTVRLIEPMDYPELVAALARSRLVLTDSGGIQEEAPTFGTPVLVLREVTERPEGIAAGVARLVGTDPAAILRHTRELLDDRRAWQAMSRAENPYGDGHAAQRIVDALAGRPVAQWSPPGG